MLTQTIESWDNRRSIAVAGSAEETIRFAKGSLDPFSQTLHPAKRPLCRRALRRVNP